ncbi:class I SAM-dependent methyltransferase [Tabrizicola sp.]|uniref:class I SAM-dependent methyltransferase n=1 Tax=Tabrizicola sp. TaxID=2005166 RepID=UPI003F35BF14
MAFQYDWFSHNIRRFEAQLMHLAGTPCRVLEIGCHEGQATCWMLRKIATHQDSSIDCIDIRTNENFWPNVSETGGLNRVTLYRGCSFEMMFRLPLLHYDFVYVDASHWTQNVLEDGVLGFRLLKVGGIMAFDDYNWDDERFNHYGRPKPSIDFFLQAYADLIEIKERSSQVWIRKLLSVHPTPVYKTIS